MKNILILTPFYPPNIGGAETFIESLVKETIKCHNLTILTFQPFKGNCKSYEEAFVYNHSLKVYRLRWLVRQSGAWQGVSLKNILSVIPSMALRSTLLCLKNKYDIIHAQGLLSGFIAVLLKKIFKVKVFITLLALYEFHNWSGLKRELVKFIFHRCDLIFVEGENGESDLIDILKIHQWKKIKQFNHWVDQELFCPPKEKPDDKIRVLFVGRPISEKGRKIIEDAEKIIKNATPHQNFKMIYKHEFIYVENATQQELAKYYQMAHIVVVPSLYSEGYSRVVAEAASCGCMVITSDKGSLPEMVKDFGFSINPTPENFRMMIESYRIRKEKTSLEYAKENFSPRNSEVFLNEYNY